jgi:hypothetical protein
MIKIILPKDKVKEAEIKKPVRVYKDKKLKKIVPAMEEVVEKAEEVKQAKRDRALARTKEDINKELRARANPLEMIGDYNGVDKPATFHCLNPNCNDIWTTPAGNILNKKIDCKLCKKRTKLSVKKEEIDEELAKRFISMPIFTGMNSKTQFFCLVPGCNHNWKTTVASVYLLGTGCKKCAGLIAPTDEEIDKRLAERNIKAITKYNGALKDMTFGCLVEGCNCVWTTDAGGVLNIKNPSGCPRCNKNEPLSNDIIDKRLQGRPIKRISDFTTSQDDMTFECLVPDCGCIWASNCHQVVSAKKPSGCPDCVKVHFYTQETFDKLLEGRNIERAEPFSGNINDVIGFRCTAIKEDGTVCGHPWTTTGYSVGIEGTGCKNCNVGYELSVEEVDKILLERGIKRRGDYKGKREHLDLTCLACGCEWSPPAYNVLRDKDPTGCIRCHKVEDLTDEVIDKRIAHRPIKRISHYEGAKIKVIWLCLNPGCGIEWSAKADNIFQGKGCPECNKTGDHEKAVIKLIKDNFIFSSLTKKEYWINGHGRTPDATITREGKTDIVVEYNGPQHYMPVVMFGGQPSFDKQVTRDKDVDDHFKFLGIPLIWIKYTWTDTKIIKVMSEYFERKKI